MTVLASILLGTCVGIIVAGLLADRAYRSGFKAGTLRGHRDAMNVVRADRWVAR